MKFTMHQLANGMQVVLEEKHNAKVISYNMLVNVGSANETHEEAGISHVIEHMLFKGTPTRPEGTIAMEVEAAGGDINAYTSLDQTVYYINMASRFADKGLNILADAVKNPLFDEKELEKESEVICEEIRREMDSPNRMLGEYIFQTTFKKHTYGRPIIGCEKTVKSFRHKNLKKYYERWYTPHNMVFVVVGDFDTDRMLKKIENEFADFKGAKPPKQDIPNEGKQDSPRMLFKKMNVFSNYLAIGFQAPELTHQDVPALDLIAHILGGSDSSRLEQEIKEKKGLVHNIYCSCFTPKHPGLFYIGALHQDSKFPEVVSAIKREIDRLKNEAVGAEELSRAKNSIRSNEIYEKETVGGLASKYVSFLAAADDPMFEKKYYQIMMDLTSEDLMVAARKYLDFKGANMVMIAPENSKYVKNKSGAKALLLKKGAKQKDKSSNIVVPKKIKLSNGATLVVRENHNLPLVSLCTAGMGGSRAETKKDAGISSFVSRMLVKGTKTRSAVQIANEIEKLAGNIGGFSGRNSTGLKSEFLSEHLHDGFELFADVLCNPAFDEKEIKREKSLALKAIKDREDQLSSLAFSKFLEELYPSHPYGFQVLGTETSVKKMSKKMLVGFHNKFFRAENLVISVVGDVNAEEVRDLAEKYLKGLRKGKRIVVKPKIDKKHSMVKTVTTKKKDKMQSHIVLGFQGTTLKSKDRFALSVLNNILSGQGGRLFRTLRDEMSLAYAVSSMNQEGVDPGYIAVYIGTDPSKTQTAIDGILCELNKVCENKIGKDEIDRSKQYLAGTYELELQRNGALANVYTFYSLYGLPFEDIEKYPSKIMKVSGADIMAVAKKYINTKAYTLSLVKP